MKAKKLERALKNAASQSSTRPILQCVHYDPDGSITATDSHIMLRLDSMHSLKQPFNLNLQTFKEIDEAYPDTLHLITDKKENPTSFQIDLKNIVAALSFLKALKDEVITLEPLAKNQKGIILKTKTQSYLLPVEEFNGDLKKISVTADNLFKCFQFYGDYLTHGQTVQVYCYGKFEPILFKSGKSTYLVTSVAVF